MIDADPAQVRGTAPRAGHLEIVRRTSMGMVVALLCLTVNLYLTGEPGAAPPAVQRAAETRDGTRQDAG